jgi:hypothetical protein
MVPHRRIALSLACLSLAAVPSLALVRDVAAQSSGSTCTLTGSPVMPKNAQLFSAASGGDVIAKFTGQATAMTAIIDPTSRAKLKTSGFRIEGFLSNDALPVFTTRNVPVAEGHVFLGGARRVTLGSDSANRLTAELTAGAPIEQTLKAPVSCSAIALDLPSFSQPSPPGNARGYLAKKSPLEIRGEAGGSSVFTFTSSSVKDALLFWSTERSAASVHVMLAGDVVVDGWVSASDLEALKPGEMMDAVAPGTTTVSTAKLAMDGSPRTGKATKDVSIRAKPLDTATPIGAIEAGVEVLVMESVTTWSNVLPTTLVMLPGDGGGFWVKTADLVIAPSK